MAAVLWMFHLVIVDLLDVKHMLLCEKALKTNSPNS